MPCKKPNPGKVPIAAGHPMRMNLKTIMAASKMQTDCQKGQQQKKQQQQQQQQPKKEASPPPPLPPRYGNEKKVPEAKQMQQK